tara:strand:- start:901 stop:1233 length:333 start_codon:yes stop_codon:yes gene_type:complete
MEEYTPEETNDIENPWTGNLVKGRFIANGMSYADAPRDFLESVGCSTTELDEAELNMLREERNKIIAESDWMANSDVTMSDEWKTYRQALRDITESYTSIYDVVWPTKPS